MELRAERRLLWVWVWADVDQPISVRRAAAEIAALGGRLGCHSCLHPCLDPHPLALRHSAEQRHHEVMGFAAWVDGTTDFGYPQGNAVVGEHRKREPELVAVERSLWLTDDDGVKAPLWVAEGLE